MKYIMYVCEECDEGEPCYLSWTVESRPPLRCVDKAEQDDWCCWRLATENEKANLPHNTTDHTEINRKLDQVLMCLMEDN